MVIGNDRLNEYWEGGLARDGGKRLGYGATRAERERWAVVKYVRGKYVAVGKENPMEGLKRKIEDERKIKGSLMEKVMALEGVRDGEGYVENHYERVTEGESGNKKDRIEVVAEKSKAFDFFADEEIVEIVPTVVES